jgi:hypothetical protein
MLIYLKINYFYDVLIQKDIHNLFPLYLIKYKQNNVLN